MQAMILAAGFGTRLLPHSALRPKPLFPVLNRPLLLATIARLRRAGCDHIIVNTHHLRGQIKTALAGTGIILIEEDAILGTGGGLRGALPFLRPEPLLVTNGDIYHDLDFTAIYQAHCRADAAVTMVMHDYPRFNKVSAAGERITGFDTPQAPGNLAFTGLHVIEPEILRDIQPGVFSSIIDHYRAMLRQGAAIHCHDVTGAFWTDMGTEADYLALHAGLLRGEMPLWPELAQLECPIKATDRSSLLPNGQHGQSRSNQLIDGQAVIEASCRLADWLAIGAARLKGGADLARAVVWDGVTVRGGVWRDCLISLSPEKEKSLRKTE